VPAHCRIKRGRAKRVKGESTLKKTPKKNRKTSSLSSVPEDLEARPSPPKEVHVGGRDITRNML
jgi:hypothetical protein